MTPIASHDSVLDSIECLCGALNYNCPILYGIWYTCARFSIQKLFFSYRKQRAMCARSLNHAAIAREFIFFLPACAGTAMESTFYKLLYL